MESGEGDLVIMKRILAGLALAAMSAGPAHAETTGLQAVKSFLVAQVVKVDAAAHDYEANAAAYQKMIDAAGGDYNQAALANGSALTSLVARMQGDYLNLHMNGYETVEGIAAGVKDLVEFDIYFDSGVPLSQASTDNPAAPVTLKTPDGRVIIDRNGNLFHYVIEACLYGAERKFVKPLNAGASAKLHGIGALPRADVLSASAKDCAREADKFLAASKRWQPTLDQCVGALVWMTPTFNGYFNDLEESLYGDNPFAYISESRVKDMRGIMGSLRLVYNAIDPTLRKKDPALAGQLKSEYEKIMAFIDESDRRDQKMRAAHRKLSKLEIEEMGNQAKTMSDQLAPQLKQAAAILGLKLPPKPILV